MGVPLLGLCYGFQLISTENKGEVRNCKVPEKGLKEVNFTGACGIFPKTGKQLKVWMYHYDCVTQLAPGFINAGSQPSMHWHVI